MITNVTGRAIRIYKRNCSNLYREYGDLIRNLPISRKCEYIDENKVLGRGTYGIVKLAKTPNRGELVVLKIFRQPINEHGISSIREICLLHKLNHENVLKLLDICCEGGKSYIISRFA